MEELFKGTFLEGLLAGEAVVTLSARQDGDTVIGTLTELEKRLWGSAVSLLTLQNKLKLQQSQEAAIEVSRIGMQVDALLGVMWALIRERMPWADGRDISLRGKGEIVVRPANGQNTEQKGPTVRVIGPFRIAFPGGGEGEGGSA